MSDWTEVARVLLGTWPGYVSSWGREALAAYIAELEARGMTPDQALIALRSTEAGAPPSAPELVAAVRSDPDRPTFDEALQQIYGPGGLFGFRRRNAPPISPWVLAFAQRYGHDRLRYLELNGEHGGIRRRELCAAWEAFVESVDSRHLASLARGERRGLTRIDPLAVVRPATPASELPRAADEG